MPSPPPIRPTFTDVPSVAGIAAMSDDEVGRRVDGARHVRLPPTRVHPAPSRVTRRRTEPTPIAETRPR